MRVKFINLVVISGDSYAVAQRFWEFSGICTAPVRLVIALIFLYKFVALLLVRDYKSCPKESVS